MSTRNTTILIALAGITIFTWYLSHHTTNLPSQEPDFETIIVGTNAEFEPFSFIENNEIVGFDIDIVKEVINRLGKNIKLKDMPFPLLIPEIQTGAIHLIAGGISPTPEREKRMLFTKPYVENDPFIVVQPAQSAKIETADDLIGKSVIVNQGYTADNYISAIDGIEVIRLSSAKIDDGLLALKNNKADAYIASKSSLLPYIEKQTERIFQYTPLKGSEESFALAVSKKYPKLLNEVQSVLDDMQKDGTIQSLRNKWKL